MSQKLKSSGAYHCLLSIYEELNRSYFSDTIGASIVWGKTGSFTGKRRVTIRLGSYHTEKKLITIHPALDQAIVPRLCVARIVYHEMLHEKHQVIRRNGKNSIHTPQFKAEEALFAAADLTDQWIKANLEKILSFKKGT